MTPGDQVRVSGRRGTFTLVSETSEVGWRVYKDGRFHSFPKERIKKKGRAT